MSSVTAALIQLGLEVSSARVQEILSKYDQRLEMLEFRSLIRALTDLRDERGSGAAREDSGVNGAAVAGGGEASAPAKSRKAQKLTLGEVFRKHALPDNEDVMERSRLAVALKQAGIHGVEEDTLNRLLPPTSIDCAQEVVTNKQFRALHRELKGARAGITPAAAETGAAQV